MRHLVLGSEGQIGKYVCEEILKRGDELIRWDIKLNPEHDLRLSVGKNLDSKLMGAMDQTDFVHFLAYDVGGSKYLSANQNSYEYIHNNMRIMENTFLALSIMKKPFYFASSQMSNMTDSVYGQLKAVGESYTKALGAVNVKFWNVYGYESDPEKSHVITDFIKMMFEDGRIICRTNGEEKRHFTYAPDAAHMLVNIAYNYQDCLDYVNNKSGFLTHDGTLHIVNPDEFWHSMIDVSESVCRNVWKYRGEDGWDGRNYCGYFSRSVDKTQTIQNDFNRQASKVLGVNYYKFTRLEDGIKEMVQLIAEDYA